MFRSRMCGEGSKICEALNNLELQMMNFIKCSLHGIPEHRVVTSWLTAIHIEHICNRRRSPDVSFVWMHDLPDTAVRQDRLMHISIPKNFWTIQASSSNASSAKPNLRSV